MKIERKWWKWALAFVAALIAAQVAVSLLVRTRRMQDFLSARLERSFGRRVEVEHFGASLLLSPQLNADNVTIGEDPAFGYEYFLRAEHLSAGFRWAGLLRGHFEFGTLSLTRPSLILVRNAARKWNLENWLPPAQITPGAPSRGFGPPAPASEANRLRKIEFDDGRVNFKFGDDKQPFAFTGVSGSVEQVSVGRWQLRLEAQPWRSGVALQSAGTLRVEGDIAGTSARLRPAQISLRWSDASLADLFRLIDGKDHGVRGIFALEATANSETNKGASGEWGVTLQARASQIHRWDLTERADNPRLRVAMLGRWNPAAATFNADQLNVEAPKSNLRGTARLASTEGAPVELHVDSAGIQAVDLLAWYRAFHTGVDDGVAAEEYFTGAASWSGWPLKLEDAAFSSPGGVIRVPGWAGPLRVGPVRGGRDRGALVLEPVRIAIAAKSPVAAAPAGKKRPGSEPANALEISFAQDMETKEGSARLAGHIDRVEDVLQISSMLGRTINYGWELTGAATADVRWDWKVAPASGQWNGSVQLSKAKLQAAGLNQTLEIGDARLEWHEGRRAAVIGKADAFGATWSGDFSETAAFNGEGASKPWTFHLHADHLDATELDRWLGPRARPGWVQRLLGSLLGGGAPATSASELVRRVNAQGELQIDEFTMEKMKLSQVHAAGALRDLKLDVPRAEAQWAGGKVRGSIRADFSPHPVYEVSAMLDGIGISQTPWAGRTAEKLTGAASGKLQLKTEGVGRDELLQDLTGRGELKFRNVELRGWDVGGSVANGSPRAGTSRWKKGSGLISVANRRVILEQLELDDDRERTAIEGQVTFGREIALTIASAGFDKPRQKQTADQRVLRLTGSLDGPHVSVEKAVAKQPAD